MSLFGLFGPPNINNLRAKGDIQGLINALRNHRDITYPGRDGSAHNVRIEAIKALGESGDNRASAPLIGLLKTTSALRRKSQSSLSIFECDESIKALGQVGDFEAIDPLIHYVVQDPSWSWMFIHKDDGRSRNDLLHSVELAFIALGKRDERAVAKLIAYLRQSNDQDTCELIINTLADIKGDPAVNALLSLLQEKSTHHKSLIRALGKIGDKRAVEPLLELVDSEDADIRGAAILSLGWIGDKRAVEVLLIKLRDSDHRVVDYAIHALGRIGDDRAFKPLVELLASQCYDSRAAAARALREIGDRRAVEPLAELLMDVSSDVRGAAAQALDTLGWQPSDDSQRAALGVADAKWDEVQKYGSGAIESLIVALVDEYSHFRAEKLLQTIDPNWAASDAAIQAIPHLVAGFQTGGHRIAGVGTGSWPFVRKIIGILKTLNWQFILKLESLLKDTKSQATVNYALSEMSNLPITEMLRAYLMSEIGVLQEGERILDQRHVKSFRETPPSIAINALQTLEAIVEQSGALLEIQGLQELAHLNDVDIIKYKYIYDKEWESESLVSDGYTLLDCSRLRQLARQELMRRKEQA